MISFLQSYFLYGLLAASLPFIIHLLNRRKTKRIQFSTLFFLKELQKKKMRRLKLRQIILLIIRAMIVAMLAFAFARPTMKTSTFILGNANVRTSAAIVLDNSMSMRLAGKSGLRYGRALEVIGQITRHMKSGDQLSLFVPCPVGELSSIQEFENAQGLVSLVRNSNPSYLPGNLIQTVNQASAHVEKSILPNKEIYILSDFQKNSWDLDKIEDESLQRSNIRYFFFDLSDDAEENIGVSEVGLKKQIIELSKPISIVGQVENFGLEAVKDRMVHAFLMDRRAGQNTVDLDSKMRKEIPFNLTLKNAGFISGEIELDDDPLLEDNKGYFTFYLHDKISLLLFGDNRDTEFIRLALAPNSERDRLFDFTEVTKLQNLSTTLSQFPLVIVADPSNFSESDVARLVQYVSSGGNLIFFPGGQTDLRILNEKLLGPLNSPSFRGSLGSLGSFDSYISWGSIDFKHPIFSNIFRGKIENVDSPEFYFRLVLEPDSKGIDVIKYGDGSAFLHVSQLEKGTIFLFTSGLDPEWNNFVFKSIFPPLIYRSVVFLASQNEQQVGAGIVGEEIQSEVFDPEASYVIVRPDEIAEKITPRQTGVSLQISYSNTTTPGIYQLKSNETILKQWAINTDPSESDLERISLDRLNTVLGGQATELTSFEAFAETINERRFGSEITKWFFIAALLFMILEMLVSREDLVSSIPWLRKIVKEGA